MDKTWFIYTIKRQFKTTWLELEIRVLIKIKTDIERYVPYNLTEHVEHKEIAFHFF